MKHSYKIKETISGCRLLRRILLSVMFFIMAEHTFCQEKNKPGWQVGINLTNGLSYTGYNIYLTPEVSYGRHNIYVGPKYVVSDSYVPYRNIWGLNLGYRYDILSNARWCAGMGIDLQTAFYKPYNPYNLDAGNKHNKVHEMFLTLSLRYSFKPDNRLYIGLNIGSGFFSESYRDLIADKVNRNFNRTNMVTLTLGYKIFRK